MGKMVEKLRVINDNLGRLNAEFERIVREHFANKWEFAVVAETWETTSHGFSGKVVDETSARHGYKKFYPASANHFGVCKPKDTVNMSYQFLTEFITEFDMPQQNSIPAARETLQMELVDDMR